MFFDPEFPDHPIPDALDHVVEVADMMSVFAAQRLRSIDALRREALTDAAARGRSFTDVVERGIRLELASALRVTEHAASALVSLAEALVHRYPAALASLERAAITERHAEILAGALDEVEPALRDALLPRAVALAESEPVGTFRRRLARMIAAERSETLDERHRQAVLDRRVAIETGDDAMSWLHLFVPTVEVHAIYARATATAKALLAADPDDSRTLDQTRADVLCDLLIDGHADMHPDAAQGIRATVTVTVPALALLCASDSDRAALDLSPAVLDGVGPIPLERAKQLCAGESGWMRILTHPETGAVVSVGREQYSPPASLRRLVRWRADRCMAPGCGVSAARCEIDHTIAWQHGGTTSVDNLAPLCVGHHKVKHHGGWQITQLSGGAIEWISPMGRRYIVEPERPTPCFRPSDEPAPF